MAYKIYLKNTEATLGVALFLGKRQVMVVDSTQQIFRGIRSQICECKQ